MKRLKSKGNSQKRISIKEGDVDAERLIKNQKSKIGSKKSVVNDNDESLNNSRFHENDDKPIFVSEPHKNINSKEYIMSLFPKILFAELYFAWSKDCNENIAVENAKWFRDELLLRKNKDERYCNFKSMRVGKNFLQAFVGNLQIPQIVSIDFSDNLINDFCMHTLKNLLTAKK